MYPLLMDTFLELQQAVQSDLTIGDESSLYPPEAVKLAINRAYTKAAGLFRWPETEDAKKTSTQANQEYYDYPQNWRSNSVWKVMIDGVRYGESPDGSPLVFQDFLQWKEDNPNSTEKKWANQWRRYFVSPIPATQGDNNIWVWGYRVVDKLVEDAEVTIFSYSMPECNEAIVLEAVAILKSKGENENSAQFRSNESKQILVLAWAKIKQDNSKYAKNAPIWDVPDFFGKGSRGGDDPTGNFNL